VVRQVTCGALAALVAVGCAGDEPAPAAAEPASCDGGGEPMVELGDGGQSDFQAFSDGVTVPIDEVGGAYGVSTELWSSGVDVTSPVTVVVKVSVDGGPTTDAVGQRNMQCNDDVGNGWDSVFAPLPDHLQTAAAAEGASGSEVTITAVITDADGESASGEVTGTLVW